MATHFIPRAGAVAGIAGLLLIGTATPGLADTGSDQAGKIVTDKLGGNVISVESDSEKGQATWEVEVENSPQYGRIEVDVAKSSGQIIACEAEDGEGTCPTDLTAGDTGPSGTVDDNDNDGDVDANDAAAEPGDNQAAHGDSAAAAPGGNGAGGETQVAPMPSGPADTGVKGTPTADHDGGLAGVAIAGGAGLALAGGGALWLRRRGGAHKTD